MEICYLGSLNVVSGLCRCPYFQVSTLTHSTAFTHICIIWLISVNDVVVFLCVHLFMCVCLHAYVCVCVCLSLSMRKELT